MDYALNRAHAKILVGYLLVAAIFGVFLITDYSNNHLTGYVVLEEGVKVSTEKMDPALVEEIQAGNTQVKVLVVLEENPQTDSSNLEQRKKGIQENQNEIIDDLQKNIGVLVPEQKKEILTSEGKVSDEEIQNEINNDKIPDAKELVMEQSAELEVTQEYETINALAAEVKSGEALVELANSDYVKKIYLDYPVSVELDQSASQIQAPRVWNYSVNGIPIDGSGETICLIDTGVDYTHAALGACDPLAYELNGKVLDLKKNTIESAHPYANNFDYTWTITKDGFSQIAVHFQNISLETLSNGDSLDRLYIYDQNFNTLAIYKESLSDVWTPAGQGNTIYVRLVSDALVTDYGFKIDKVINGNTSINLHWERCSKVIGGWDAYNNDPDPKDDHGHGTHVAGIIASTDSTYKGIAPGAKLVAVKALSASGSGYSSDVVAGIDWCNNNAQEYGISVISMSLGCNDYSCKHYQEQCPDDLTAAAIGLAHQQNISVFIAAGNSGWTDGISNPACVPYATPVGGVNENDQVLFNRGNLLKIVAPATNIMSTVTNNGWLSLSGTSMATPHVAGAAALLRQYWKLAYQNSATPEEIEERLYSTGKMISDSGLSLSRVDAYAALGIVINETVNETLPLNETTPVNETVPVNDTNPINQTIPTNETSPVNETIPINDTLPTNETVPINDTVPNNESTPVNDTLPVTEIPENQTQPVNETLPINETSPINETAPINQTAPVNETIPVNDTLPVNQTTPLNQSNSTQQNHTLISGMGNITSPLTGTILEVGNSTFYNLTSNLSGELTYLWDFGDGSNSSAKSGNKQYNSTGNFTILVNISNANQSTSLNTSIIVTDTTAPTVLNFNYLSTVHLEEDVTQKINLTLFDYSNLSSVKLNLNSLTKTYTQNSTSYFWNISGLTLRNYTLFLEFKDNSALKNGVNYTYNFMVISCSDGIKNGHETGIDCGGSCSNCTSNITTVVTVENTSVVSTPEVTVSSSSNSPAPITITRTENSVNTQAVASTSAQTLQEESQPLNLTNDLKETKTNRQQKALYYLGSIVVILFGLYAGMMIQNNKD